MIYVESDVRWKHNLLRELYVFSVKYLIKLCQVDTARIIIIWKNNTTAPTFFVDSRYDITYLPVFLYRLKLQCCYR